MGLVALLVVALLLIVPSCLSKGPSRLPLDIPDSALDEIRTRAGLVEFDGHVDNIPKLGMGGFSIVFLGKRVAPVQALALGDDPVPVAASEPVPVAVKLCNVTRTRPRQNFEREALYNTQVQQCSSHVLRVIDSFVVSPHIGVLVLEFFTGGDLQSFIKKPIEACVGRSPNEVLPGLFARDVLAIMHSMVRSLITMRALDLVHMDIKLKNVFVQYDKSQCRFERAALADFGLSLSLVINEDIVRTSKYRGTSGYRAPEFLERKVGTMLDSSIDVWALGRFAKKLAHKVSQHQHPESWSSDDQALEKPVDQHDLIIDFLTHFQKLCLKWDPLKRATPRTLLHVVLKEMNNSTYAAWESSQTLEEVTKDGQFGVVSILLLINIAMVLIVRAYFRNRKNSLKYK